MANPAIVASVDIVVITASGVLRHVFVWTAGLSVTTSCCAVQYPLERLYQRLHVHAFHMSTPRHGSSASNSAPRWNDLIVACNTR
jgi:hypothetical protein